MKNIRPDLIERIDKVVKNSGLSVNAFATKAGIDQGGMRRKIAGNETITNGNIHKIATAFGVNREWLDTGEGEMYSTPHYNIGGNTNIGSHVENSVQLAGEIPMDKIADILKNAASKDMLIEILQKQIDELKEQNSKLMEIIANNHIG